MLTPCKGNPLKMLKQGCFCSFNQAVNMIVAEQFYYSKAGIGIVV